MSIVVNLFYTGTNGSAIKFVEEMEQSGTADLIRQEKGNEGYDYFISMADRETVLLVDKWKDQASIDAHHATSMMATITTLREKYDLHMSVKRYISDEDGVPEHDLKFIKE